MKQPRILYVEDDVTLAFLTRDNLQRAGYEIDYCEDGISAFEKIIGHSYDLYILDVMLPKIDGFTLAKKIRERSESAPILFLSAKSTPDDKIAGLQLGADDYITKPFSVEELILKIEIFLKRSKVESSYRREESCAIGNYIFSKANQLLTLNGKAQTLTHREAALLDLLSQNKNSIVKRDDILSSVWGNDHFFSSRSLDVFVSRLRKLLKDDPKVKIENIHNIGYRLIVGN